MLVQLLGLVPQPSKGVNVASKIAGAFTASNTAGRLLFTLPSKVRGTAISKQGLQDKSIDGVLLLQFYLFVKEGICSYSKSQQV